MTYGLSFFANFIFLNGSFVFSFFSFFFWRDDPCSVAFFVVQVCSFGPFDLLFEKGVLLCRQKKCIILLSTHNVIRIDIFSLVPFHTFQIPRFEFRRGCKSCYAVSSRYSRLLWPLWFRVQLVTKLNKKKKKRKNTNVFRARILDKFRTRNFFLSRSRFLLEIFFFPFFLTLSFFWAKGREDGDLANGG